MALKTYNSKEVSIIVGSHIVSGFSTDSMVTVARDEDSWIKTKGVKGEVTRSRSNDNAGSITIMLLQSSKSNSFLSDLLQQDELDGSGIVNVLVRDASGESLYEAAESWIRKHPDSEFKREVGDREWILDCAELISATKGN